MISHVEQPSLRSADQIDARTLVIARYDRSVRHHGVDGELEAAEQIVRRADIGMTENRLDRALQSFEITCTGVRLVAEKLARTLLLAHRIDGPRTHVERDLFGVQIEHVELCVRQVLLALLGREER